MIWDEKNLFVCFWLCFSSSLFVFFIFNSIESKSEQFVLMDDAEKNNNKKHFFSLNKYLFIEENISFNFESTTISRLFLPSYTHCHITSICIHIWLWFIFILLLLRKKSAFCVWMFIYVSSNRYTPLFEWTTGFKYEKVKKKRMSIEYEHFAMVINIIN